MVRISQPSSISSMIKFHSCAILDIVHLRQGLIHRAFGRKELGSPMMDLYYGGLVAGGIEGYGREDFEYDFRLSVLSCVFCPIIWKRGFSVRSAMSAFEDWGCEALLT